MLTYSVLKLAHVTCAAISLTLFVVRGIWMLTDSPRLRARWARIVPHANDTVLLAAAIALAIQTAQAPWTQAWLAAKIAGLVVYVLLGMLALRWGRSRQVRAGAWFAALGTFAYIVAVALTRDPWPV